VTYPIERHPPPYGSLQALATSTGFTLTVTHSPATSLLKHHWTTTQEIQPYDRKSHIEIRPCS
jgi:hypothetical protein